MIILAVTGASYVYFKGADLLRWGAAKVVTSVIDTVIEDNLQLPPEEHAAVMRPIEAFGMRIADGEVDPEVAAGALTKLIESNEAAVVALRGFETRYVDADVIPEAEQPEAILAVNRFANGLLDGRIKRASLAPLVDIAVVEVTAEDGTKSSQIKDPLPEEDVRAALAHIVATVQAAGIQDEYAAQDLEAMVEAAIQRAVAEAEAEQAGVPVTEPVSDDLETEESSLDDAGSAEEPAETEMPGAL
ncbi:MAG: hypothetical protein PF961_17125 [Planctomycetota bacterium]|jgi:hypothetical protein|nr:hypothetical protein [Planctomycetota bacterium]